MKCIALNFLKWFLFHGVMILCFRNLPWYLRMEYLCIWHYYKDRFIISWKKISLLHAQTSPSYWHPIQISTILPLGFPYLATTLADHFPLLYYLRFLLTGSQAAVFICLNITFLWKKKKSVQDYVRSAIPSNHCPPSLSWQP